MREIRRLADKSDKWSVEFDDEWVTHNETLSLLRDYGYSIAVFKQDDGYLYTLANVRDVTSESSPIIFETTDPQELNNYINLILPPRPTRS